MNQDELKLFLVNMKLIYQHGVLHSKNRSRLHRLLAIHNCHYVVEQIIREQAKDMTFRGALHKIGFDEIIKRVHEKKNVPEYGRLLRLNRIRNDAEHLNIIPDADDVRVYVKIVHDFLVWSYKQYYDVDYDKVELEDMIYDDFIRKVMLNARALIEKNDLPKASKKMYEGLAAFKFLAFGFLSDPRVSHLSIGGVNLSNLLADLAFKIILAEDESALKKLGRIPAEFTWQKNGWVGVKSTYPQPTFRDKDEANQHYEDILNIILNYQDKIPSFIWRKEKKD